MTQINNDKWFYKNLELKKMANLSKDQEGQLIVISITIIQPMNDQCFKFKALWGKYKILWIVKNKANKRNKKVFGNCKQRFNALIKIYDFLNKYDDIKC